MNKKNAKITKSGNITTIEEVNEKFTPDPLFPYIKKATKHKIENATTLFSRYVAFYSTLISSGSDQNIITTESILTIGKEYNLGRDTVEKCIKDLIAIEELIKVKRGIYMLNPKHISGGRTAAASQELIRKAEALTQNVFNAPVTNIIVQEGQTLTQAILEYKKEQDKLLNL